MTDPIAWMAAQIAGAKPAARRTHMVNAELSRREILAWIKSQRRPVTWIDVADKFKIGDQLARRRLQELSGFLTIDTSMNGKGLPARYTPRDTK